MGKLNLSESEVRFVRTWKKWEGSWRWVRWLNLCISILLIVLSIRNVMKLIALQSGPGSDTALVAWIWPICCFMLLLSSGWLGFILSHWRGNMRTRLLLRLIEEHEKEDA